MNIHEYQAKELLAKFGVPVPAGYAAMSVDEAVDAANKLPGPLWVVKAQIHAGGRGKGKFTELGPDAKGGVRLARSIEEVEANAREMLGNTLVKITTIVIDPAQGFMPHHGRALAFGLKLTGDLNKQAQVLGKQLYEAFL